MSAPPFPQSDADLTANWFTAALQRRFPGAKVASADQIHRINGTASKYRYRLSYDEPGIGATPPATLWVKGGFETGGADQGDAFANEVRFYLELAPDLSINLPDCYFGLLEPATNNGVILLEDLINRQVHFGSALEPLSLAQAKAVLDVQARYHARYWNAPNLKQFSWLKAGGAIAGSGMVGQYFSGFWEASQDLPRFRHVTGRMRDRTLMESALNRMVDGDARNAHCLVHGDSHCANLFFDGEGRPGYLDWQHVMRGHWAFDVCNLLITGLTVDDRRRFEHDLLTGYRDTLIAHGAEAPMFDTMWDDYRRHAVWAFMWTMCPVSAHPEAVCEVNAERGCTAIMELDSLAL